MHTPHHTRARLHARAHQQSFLYQLINGVGYCFPEHDHQLLTDHGFMFLEQVEAHVRRDARGRVVDWRGLRVASYNATTQQLEYKQPRALVVNKPRSAGSALVELTHADAVECWSSEHAMRNDDEQPTLAMRNGVSIVCTPNHELYVADASASSSSSATAFAKLPASAVLRDAATQRDASRTVRLLARAVNGVGVSAAADSAVGAVPASLESMLARAYRGTMHFAFVHSLGLKATQVRVRVRMCACVGACCQHARI